MEDKVDDRPGVCRNAPAAASQRRTSVPLDRHNPGRRSLDFVRADVDYDAGRNGPQPLPVGARSAASGGPRPILTVRYLNNLSSVYSR